MRLRTILLFVWVVMMHGYVNAQVTPVEKPEVGKPMPEFFLNNITHYKSTTASRSDFKDKWLVLDFWFQGCTACIQSFPSVNAHYKKFKDKLTWILVGLNDQEHNKNAQVFYEKLRAKQGLEMPVAYDSVLNKRWGIHSMPHIIIVNPQGIVHSITGGRDITTEKLERLLQGEDVRFYPKDIERPKFTVDDTVSVADTSGNRVFYRSVLCAWNGEQQKTGAEIERWVTWPKEYLREGYTMSMIPLYALYNYAYWGQWSWDFRDEKLFGHVYPNPVLEIRDTSLFVYNYTDDVGKGTYNYSLTIPVAEVDEETIKRYLQEDLRRAFKYVAVIEKREIPVWKLIAKKGAVEKLRTKGAKQYASSGSHAAGYTLTNWPSNYLIGSLSYFMEERIQDPFVDGTGISGNIDFTIEADMTNLEAIGKALRKQGFDFVKSTQMMEVLVIREPVKD
jgi:peroxiredoxin